MRAFHLPKLLPALRAERLPLAALAAIGFCYQITLISMAPALEHQASPYAALLIRCLDPYETGEGEKGVPKASFCAHILTASRKRIA